MKRISSIFFNVVSGMFIFSFLKWIVEKVKNRKTKKVKERKEELYHFSFPSNKPRVSKTDNTDFCVSFTETVPSNTANTRFNSNLPKSYVMLSTVVTNTSTLNLQLQFIDFSRIHGKPVYLFTGDDFSKTRDFLQQNGITYEELYYDSYSTFA